MTQFAQIKGLDDVVQALRGLPRTLRRKVLRNALAAGARVFRDAARAAAPVAAAPVYRNSGLMVRKPGTVRKAIVVRTSKRDARQGDVGVFVNVRPAAGAKYKAAPGGAVRGRRPGKVLVKASKRGANSPDDPFYWRWLEFGSSKLRPFRFLRRAADKSAQALEHISKSLSTAVSKMNRKGGTL